MSTDAANEFALDVEELKSLRKSSTRPAVQRALDGLISDTESRMRAVKTPVVKASETPDVKKLATVELLPTIKITNYALDQSPKFIKLYFKLDGVHDLDAKQIVSNITERDFHIVVNDLKKKNYTITFKDLLEDIDPSASQVKQKPDDLLVMLRKKNEGKTWEALTKAEYVEKEKTKPKFDDKADPQSSMMNMMKQLYDTGDDEMKRNIRKAWHEGQNKKGSVPGMPPMDF